MRLVLSLSFDICDRVRSALTSDATMRHAKPIILKLLDKLEKFYGMQEPGWQVALSSTR
jgi:hypothetical protein